MKIGGDVKMKLYYCYNKVMNLWVTEFRGYDRKVASKEYWDDFMGEGHRHYELVPMDKVDSLDKVEKHVKN